MIECKVEFDYLTADADEWLDDVSVLDDGLTDEFRAKVAELGIGDDYASQETVTTVLQALGYTLTGIYGEDGPVSVAMCNEDTLLSRDLSFVFAHLEREDDSRAVIVTTGEGYFADRLEYVTVRDFIGDDDADAFGYSHGFVGHDTRQDCSAEWILDDPSTLWPNGGGTTHRVDECILPDEEGNPRLVCPECGDTLTAYVS